jgi:hypothetical protein
MAIASTIFVETTHNIRGFHNPLETCQARKININEIFFKGMHKNIQQVLYPMLSGLLLRAIKVGDYYINHTLVKMTT